MAQYLFHHLTRCWRIPIVKHTILTLLFFICLGVGPAWTTDVYEDDFFDLVQRYKKDAKTNIIRDEGQLFYEMLFKTKKSPQTVLDHFYKYLDQNKIPYKYQTTDPKEKVMAHMLHADIDGEKKRVIITPAGFKSNDSFVIVRSEQSESKTHQKYPSLFTSFPEVGSLFEGSYVAQESFSETLHKGAYGVDVEESPRSVINRSLRSLRKDGWKVSFGDEVNANKGAQDDHVFSLKKGNAFLALISIREDGQTTLAGILKHAL